MLIYHPVRTLLWIIYIALAVALTDARLRWIRRRPPASATS
jgi:hypothetical protein